MANNVREPVAAMVTGFSLSALREVFPQLKLRLCVQTALLEMTSNGRKPPACSERPLRCKTLNRRTSQRVADSPTRAVRAVFAATVIT